MNAALVRRGLQALIWLLVGVLVLEAAFHLVAAPSLRLTRVVFTGDRPKLDAGGATVLLGIREREYYFSVDEVAIEARLAALPWVKSVDVNKTFPDTLTVDLKVRRAVAVSLVGGAVLPIDDEGLVFDVRTDARGLDLPVISGIAFESLRAGARFPEAVRPLFPRLAELRAESPTLYKMLSEIQLRTNDRGSFDTVVYPALSQVRVVLGDRWDEGTLNQVFVLLDLLARQGLASETREIDFRTTPVVLRPREG